ncbi:MAG: SDR family NAD(P)-dependent oxidoreductase [Dehalococcoidia bacterium]|nr:SDR family NAD(P)-dependent oxidoreductase [Dehalococcoidia bacterium]
MGKLDGRVAIVTGASRGIGEEIAKVFAAEGAKVICAARTLREGDHRILTGSLEHTVTEIKEAGGNATAVACNLADEADCRRLVEETKRIYGPADILVNNAMMSYLEPAMDLTTKRWDLSYAVNVRAPFILSTAVLPDMVKRHHGAIVNISSGAAIGPGRGPYKAETPANVFSLYGSTKAALERFTQGLAQEVFRHGVSVSCLAPSQVVPTPVIVRMGMVKGIDDPRGEPPDVMARAALLLASEPVEKTAGRVTYDQAILKEFGWIKSAKGTGVDTKGSGYSQS